MKLTYLILSALIILTINASGTFAIIISSPNYTVSMYTAGLQGSDIESESLNGKLIATAFQESNKNAIGNEYIANIGFFSNTTQYRTVFISSYSIYPKSAVTGSIIRFGISAKNAQVVWLNMQFPNGSSSIIALVNDDYTYYTASDIGRYNITFYSNHSSGAIASAVDYFEITETPATPPSSPSGSSGGGGGGGGAPSCNYVWDCDSWSLCTDNVQTRICKNIGTCTGTVGKPIESRQCSEALFDVQLKIDNIEMISEESLAFNVDLIQTKSIDKIDVQIKYTILDNEKSEISTQIETRAVETNISYRKILDEIKLKPGNYAIKIDIIYGNMQRADAYQTFKVNANHQIETESQDSKQYNFHTLLIMGLLLVVITLTIIIIYLVKRDNKKRNKKHNSLNNLLKKKVYSSLGHYVGKIEDVILHSNKIGSIKIKFNKKHGSLRGVVLKWKYVHSCGEIVIINHKVISEIHKIGKV